MALFNCPECENPVSTDAYVCPRCGKRLKYFLIGAIINVAACFTVAWERFIKELNKKDQGETKK